AFRTRLSVACAGTGATIPRSGCGDTTWTQFLAMLARARRRTAGKETRGISRSAGDDGRRYRGTGHLRAVGGIRAEIWRALRTDSSRRPAGCAAGGGKKIAIYSARNVTTGDGISR